MVVDTQMQNNKQLTEILLLLSNVTNNNFTRSDNSVKMTDEEVQLKLELQSKIAYARQVHPYKIYYSEKSGYFTSVDDSTKAGGKRKIRKVSEERLWIELFEWYTRGGPDVTEDKSPTIASVYRMYIDWKHIPGRNDSNIRRIETAWQTYFQNEPLAQKLINKPMHRVTSLELREFAEAILRKHAPVDRKKVSRIFRPLAVAYEYASDEDRNIVSLDLWASARQKLNKDLISVHVTPSDESQVFSDNERIMLRNEILDDLKKKKSKPTSAGLLILFLFEVGLRSGEACALKWSDIKDGYLYVQRQADNNGVKDWTKSVSGMRSVPLTDEALHILELNRQYNETHGLTAEWIFQSKDPNIDYRLSYCAVNNKLAKLCEKLGIPKRTAHKIRKTCLSALMDNPDVNNRTVQRFAGHSCLSTTMNYYNFDRSSKEKQARAINDALALPKEND